MKGIASFKVDHTRLERGIYVSRKDVTPRGEVITTIDIRVKKPNHGMMQPEVSHTIEHIGATILRNDSKWKEKVIYFGPMGCLTGFYLILAGDYDSVQVIDLIRDMFIVIADYVGKIPGSTPKECGNYSFHDLKNAKSEADEFVKFLENIKVENLSYPFIDE